jgi:hypothetical protein
MSTDSRRDGTSTVVPGGERVFFSCYIYSIERRKAPSDARGGGGRNIQSVVARSSLSVRLLRAFLITVRTVL